MRRGDPMSADEAVSAWALEPHPEGGFYRRTYRSPLETVVADRAGSRALATAILYLLPAGARSAWHRVRSDELWCWQGGAAMALHVEDRTEVLGPEPGRGQVPQALVPARAWQSASPVDGPWSLVGCVVVPGFDWSDFELRHD